MAAVFDPQVMPAQLPLGVTHTPQVSISCVGLLYDATTNRTFRIPDVPATSSVAHIKQWYSSNVSETAVDPRSLVVIHNAQPVEDTTQVWQLAQGQGQFAVTVAHQAKSPRSMLSLYIDSALAIPPLPLCISSDSTVLYVKQRIFEMLNLPMALASAPHTSLILPPSTSPLQNNLTLEACGIVNNSRLSLAFQQDSVHENRTGNVQFQHRLNVTPATTYGSQPQYARIKEIWADNDNSPSLTNTLGTTPQLMAPDKSSAASSHALLPSLLLEDEDDEEVSVLSEFIGAAHNVGANQRVQHNCTPNTTGNIGNGLAQKSRGRRRSRSPPGGGNSELSQDQLQQLAANFRTKMCRNGPSCKFGRNCWFAHIAEELRKPADPLPNNLPAVHKLERYSHREANAAKDRHSA